MKQILLLALALIAACSSASNYEPDTSVDWPSQPIDLTRAETYHDSGPIDLSGELDLGQLIEIAADRNPRLAAARQRWLASAQRPAQASALPDPLLRYTEFIEPIETRAGPLNRRFDLTQPIPWPCESVCAAADSIFPAIVPSSCSRPVSTAPTDSSSISRTR